MTMNSPFSKSDDDVSAIPAQSKVTLSPRANEKLPSFQDLLSAHDVARLKRRPKLVLSALMLLGRFPKRQRFRGRQVGWPRSDVLEWMTRDLAPDDGVRIVERTARRCAKATPRQSCPPFDVDRLARHECPVPRPERARAMHCAPRREIDKPPSVTQSRRDVPGGLGYRP